MDGEGGSDCEGTRSVSKARVAHHCIWGVMVVTAALTLKEGH
jgi:hypothetical protein